MALSVALVALWLRHREPGEVYRQAAALLLLIAILLPVVSLTDDLQAMSNPPETEHLLRRDGPLTPSESGATHHPAAPVLLSVLHLLAGAGRMQRLGEAEERACPLQRSSGYSSASSVRPPPCLALA